MFTSIHFSAFHYHVMEMLNEKNINALLTPCHVGKIYPDGHPNKEWWNFKTDHDRIWQVGVNSVFGFLLQNQFEHGITRDMSTLLEFRHRILMPLIDRGLDENLHIIDFNTSDPSTKSTYPNVFVELIRNGLRNSNISSPV